MKNLLSFDSVDEALSKLIDLDAEIEQTMKTKRDGIQILSTIHAKNWAQMVNVLIFRWLNAKTKSKTA